MKVIRLVFTPVYSAATRLPPVASTCRPKRVLFSTTQPMATATTVHSSRPGIGPRLPPPKIALNVSFRIGMGADLVMSWARPDAIPSMASVTRNDGMPRTVTRPPLTMPTTSPTARPASTPKIALPVAETASAAQTLDRPATDPTDRSIWAAEMTKVIATAITEMIAVCRKMLSRFVPERKPSSARKIAKSRKTTAKPM